MIAAAIPAGAERHRSRTAHPPTATAPMMAASGAPVPLVASTRPSAAPSTTDRTRRRISAANTKSNIAASAAVTAAAKPTSV